MPYYSRVNIKGHEQLKIITKIEQISPTIIDIKINNLFFISQPFLLNHCSISFVANINNKNKSEFRVIHKRIKNTNSIRFTQINILRTPHSHITTFTWAQVQSSKVTIRCPKTVILHRI